MTRFFPALALSTVFSLAACSGPSEEPREEAAEADPQVAFMDSIRAHCGEAFEGRLVSDDEADADIASERLVMHVADCAPDRIRIPFHVGEDRSRTWVLTDTGTGILVKHDHRHEDGSEDAVTQYGGETADAGSATRQEFPVDDESIGLFEREGLSASVTNVWAMEVTDDIFAYELRRPAGENERFFRVEFDLSEPVETPPPAWGSEE